ncbi:MAG: hypothetical protein MRY49_00210 [Candidatus Pacebacteria bacterium]|nr:hypothetical protein [Candidatus Paceibacterota bacterium]
MIDIVKILIPAVTSFVIGIIITPALTSFLYSNKMWKKKAGKVGLDGKETEVFNNLHKDKEINTPRMGGIVIWFSALLTVFIIWLVSEIFPTDVTIKLDFLSRNQTWIPVGTLLIGALVGLVDDLFEIKKGNGGLSLKKRLVIVTIVSLLVAFWFFFKLDIVTLGLPFLGEVYIGWLIIPLFVIVTLAIYSGGVIDGIDGLAGGVFGSIFLAYAGIAFYQSQIDLAAFCVAVAGGILAFLWFNIPPARFYMTETGSMALTITLGVVAFMTDSLGGGYGVIVLPMIAFPLVITTGSVLIQVFSKRFRGKKVFLSAPIHHHFEAIGWPSYKVTMRYWVISLVCALLGVIIALVG